MILRLTPVCGWGGASRLFWYRSELKMMKVGIFGQGLTYSEVMENLKIKKTRTRGAQRSSLNLIGFYLHKDLFTIRWRRACVTKDVNRLAQPVARWLRGPWPSLATPRQPSPPLACDLSRRLPDSLLSATARFAGRRLENISTCTYRGSGCLEQRGRVDCIADIKADSWVSLSARMLY